MTGIRHFLRHRAALAGLERSRPQALAGALTATLATALFTVGGVSYAATAASGALKVVRKAVAPQAGRQAIVVQGISAGGDQYRPGYGFGDPNHNHTGPPGLQRQGGDAAPPLRGRVVSRPHRPRPDVGESPERGRNRLPAARAVASQTRSRRGRS